MLYRNQIIEKFAINNYFQLGFYNILLLEATILI